MASSSERKDEEPRGMMPTRGVPSEFDNFMREMERMTRERMTRPWSMPMEERMARPWSMPMDWQQFPSTIFEARDRRMALYELADRGDKFELQVEVPGIEKEKIDVKATKYSIEISFSALSQVSNFIYYGSMSLILNQILNPFSSYNQDNTK
jgi:HSP20 family protein